MTEGIISLPKLLPVCSGSMFIRFNLPFPFFPSNPSSGGFNGAGVKSKDIVIDNIPYEYAVPMLTGWDVGYTVSDQHVKEIGIWIDEISYREPNDPPGRLRYKVSSVLHDDDTFPDNYFRHKITVLGLGAKGSVVQQRAVNLCRSVRWERPRPRFAERRRVERCYESP